MKRILTLLLIIICLSKNYTAAKINVVYPSKQNYKVDTDTVFVIGNIDNGSDFFINSEPVRLWNNNFFVEVLPLKTGNNIIEFKSVKDGKTESKIYNIYRQKEIQKKLPDKYAELGKSKFYFTRTIKDSATIRNLPNGTSERIVDLPKNTLLYLTGKNGNYYKIDTSSKKEFWIHKSNIGEISEIQDEYNAILYNVKKYEDDLYYYTKFILDSPVMFDIKNDNDTLTLTLHNVEKKYKKAKIHNNLEYKLNFNQKILAYEGYYQNNNLIIKVAKIPKFESNKSILSGINIFIDAGHGGTEKGSVGPTGICEKDINLAIVKKIVAQLKKEGANVTYSRLTDKNVGLYERVLMAKKNNALISISIHNNALPDGKNPYINHGIEVHYYNDEAKVLADIIQENLVNDLNLKDNKIHKSSFVMTRSTNPLSVLLETGYMINPEEYMLLQNPEFQQKIAESVKKSIEKYILLIKKSKKVI